MSSNRLHIIWMPHNASGKIREVFISAFLIRIFGILILLCLCAMPLLEIQLWRFSSRINELKEKKKELQTEISDLNYVKQALSRIEEKEKRLSSYFGLDGYLALDKVTGGGEPEAEWPESGSEKNDDVLLASAHHGMNLPRKLGLLDSNYEILGRLADKKIEIWERTPSILPVQDGKTKISSEFGWRNNPFTQKREFHAGIDVMGGKTTKIIAPASGIVLTTGHDDHLGKYLVLQHLEGIKTIYGHLGKISVNKGKAVARGDVIAVMGNTGLSTGTHLHYVVLVNQKPVDPRQYILDRQG